MTRRITKLATGIGMLLIGGVALAQDVERLPAPAGAMAYIISPADGETVSNPVTIRFGLAGMGVAPAGVDVGGTGHHHLIINVDPANYNFDDGVPSDDNHRHFGGGQTEVTLDLPAGTHTMWTLVGDYLHVPHEPPVMSEVITITVE